MAKLENLNREVFALKTKTKKKASPVYGAELFTLRFHSLDYLIEDVLRLG